MKNRMIPIPGTSLYIYGRSRRLAVGHTNLAKDYTWKSSQADISRISSLDAT